MAVRTPERSLAIVAANRMVKRNEAITDVLIGATAGFILLGLSVVQELFAQSGGTFELETPKGGKMRGFRATLTCHSR